LTLLCSVAPLVVEPPGHALQASSLSNQYVSAAHAVHAPLPLVSFTYPGEHGTHSLPTRRKPASQRHCSIELAPPALMLWSGHGSHASAPGAPEKVSAGQAAHASPAAAENVPAGQAAHCTLDRMVGSAWMTASQEAGTAAGCGAATSLR